MANMKEFLLQYFMQLRFNDMPAATRAKFDEYVAANDFTGNMKEWAKKLLAHDASGNPIKVGNSYESAALPDPTQQSTLSDDEAKKLFKEFQTTFSNMAANAADFAENADATNFLNDYFGLGRLFQNATASAAAEAKIQGPLKQMLNNHSELETILQNYGIWSDGFSFADLKRGIASRKYNSDPKFKDNLIRVVRTITNIAAYEPEIRAQLGVFDFNDIIDGFETTITAAQLTDFRRELPLMLRTIHSKAKVRDVFTQQGGNKITAQYEAAKQKLGYDDKNSDDYVPPKRQDELTPLQQLRQWADDTYDQVLKKYITFKGDTLYLQPQAKNIISAMAKAKIKPTDGLDAIISKADDIKKALQYKVPLNAVKHFDWTVKALSELKATMPKAFAGALQNGGQLRAIVEQIIIKAVEEGKIAEAKTAMEMLSICKYGMATSKIMDALRSQDFTVFSDGGLSWNKQEGMKFVSTALDKSIKAAFLGVGYAITITGNMYNLRSGATKFKGRSKNLVNRAHTWDAQNATNRANAAADNARRDANDRTVITDQTNLRDDVNRTLAPGQRVLDDTNIDAEKTALDTARAAEKTERDRLNGIKATDWYNAINNFDTFNQRANELRTTVIPQKQADKHTLEAQFSRVAADTTIPDAVRTVRLQEIARQIQQVEYEIQEAERDATDNEAQRDAIQHSYTAAQWTTMRRDFTQANTDSTTLDATAATNNETERRINQYKDATAIIKEREQAIADRAAKQASWDADHKNTWIELMSYWDFLETGRMTHLGPTTSRMPFTAKTNQKRFDNKKADLLQRHFDNYRLH